ncbi:MAG: hypothetical protein J0L69_07665 [Bacteroidetes bacterium]|nr:hypothetical protein [Bacteroidota bacterium]
MKRLFYILIFSSSLTIFGQTHDISSKTIFGSVIDSSTSKPIAGASIWVNFSIEATTDSIGRFKQVVTSDSFLLWVSAKNYERKYVKNYSINKPMTIGLVPYDVEKEFIITGKPLDTIYFKNKTISKIIYQFKDEITYYPNGQIKSKTVRDSYREWYQNGKLKYQSISNSPHLRTETAWYQNGQIKEQGSVHWGNNPKTNAGDWFKSADYKYWTEDGKETKRTTK